MRIYSPFFFPMKVNVKRNSCEMIWLFLSSHAVALEELWKIPSDRFAGGFQNCVSTKAGWCGHVKICFFSGNHNNG